MKDIYLGHTLPAFSLPNLANVLVEKFGIAGILNVEDDIEMSWINLVSLVNSIIGKASELFMDNIIRTSSEHSVLRI